MCAVCLQMTSCILVRSVFVPGARNVNDEAHQERKDQVENAYDCPLALVELLRWLQVVVGHRDDGGFRVFFVVRGFFVCFKVVLINLPFVFGKESAVWVLFF